MGVIVNVNVGRTVLVGVGVGVQVGVGVSVGVSVVVGDGVGVVVTVGVAVNVGVGVAAGRLLKSTEIEPPFWLAVITSLRPSPSTSARMPARGPAATASPRPSLTLQIPRHLLRTCMPIADV